MADLGVQMHALCRELFPICRSITGDGFRKSLAMLGEHLPGMEVVEVPTGTRCFDWEVPREWNIRDAYMIAPDGSRLCDFKTSNLHVMGYSTPVNTTMSLDALQDHLHSLPNQPDAIPYVTSYYKERWGFCISQKQRDQLKPGQYKVVIDSDLKAGSLTYGQWIIPGQTEQEVFLSSYLCHPSMANDQLSGPVVTTFLAKWLAGLANRRYTYRIIIIPETIGSIAYLSKHYLQMKKNIVAGYNLACVGDDRAYSYLPSRLGDTLADRTALHVLKHSEPDYVSYSYLDRGSDERQYCSPGIDLPLCSMQRSMIGQYPEYHTSLDDLNFVTPTGLLGGYEVHQKAIRCLELNETLEATVLCEPQLGKRGLYPTISTRETAAHVMKLVNFLAYADGRMSNLEIAEKINQPLWELKEMIDRFISEGLLKRRAADDDERKVDARLA